MPGSSIKRLVASWRILLGVWIPRFGRIVGADSQGAKDDENRIRRVLRLRLQSAAALAAYLDTPGEEGKATERVLRMRGATIASLKMDKGDSWGYRTE